MTEATDAHMSLPQLRRRSSRDDTPSSSGRSPAMRGLMMLEMSTSRYNRLPRKFRAASVGMFLASALAVLFLTWVAFAGHVSVLFMALVVASVSMALSWWLLAWILRFDTGTAQMNVVAEAIREGSESFLAVQYGTILHIAAAVGASLFVVFAVSGSPVVGMGQFGAAFLPAFSFCAGAVCSALAGYSGMWVSVRANVRVASAAGRCYNQALQLCFRGGAFSSIINVSMAVFGLAGALSASHFLWPEVPFTTLPSLLTGFGFGASLVAMFAQLGGGIFTKAADIGADLVGKIESEIPEDDPRNPAVIADLVGDNVGDCAGQCADLFESIVTEILSAMILGCSVLNENTTMKEKYGYVVFPLAVHCVDLVASSVGILTVRTTKGMPVMASRSGGAHDPMRVLMKGYLFTIFWSALGFGIVCRWLLHVEHAPTAWLKFAMCGFLGMCLSVGFVVVTQAYTDYKYSHVQALAKSSVTGPATNIISGLALGLESTSIPVVMIVCTVLASYYLGASSGLNTTSSTAGLFGIAVATMGMLSNAVFVLSMSSLGPIADNAGGIVEMSMQPQQVRDVTDRLDAVGNVTKANTKGFSVGSASLAAFLMFSAFMDEVQTHSGLQLHTINIASPEVFAGALLGSGLVFLFCAWSMAAVGGAAEEVVKEVRRQFRDNPEIMTFSKKPDYHACVAISSRAALKEMVKPGLLAALTPVFVGLLFKWIGWCRDVPLMSVEVMGGFLISCTITGILMALFLNNAGGAWDNAKKYIETGAFGGKNSSAHKAAVVGDTVGDPCKDTAGPSVHVLMKLVSTVAMVMMPVFLPFRT
ncbi:MAG: uncharacterized protein KVP18_003779 [Porospora cf. gigantea A]|uniref:uncharacterized protein n=1 Tax=Porospora cf. gigantea A TaxID=2853593 RepID=UPI00355A2BAB|nr:MAG: hypothetical protein KVP18_003779 [Porospora cf. gigantea A]